MGLPFLVVLFSLAKIVLGVKYNITSLPGYDGELPFNLESGYVGVENDTAQYFYLFAESQRNSAEDPILFWITGGPGCSSLRAFFLSHGPVKLDTDNYSWDGSLPKLLLNGYAWTKGLSIIYFDGPIGTGYSYGTTAEIYESGDSIFVKQIYEFLQQWLLEHPQFSENSFYFGGDGYSGNLIPVVTQTVLDGNEAGNISFLNIKGYMLGNPGADFSIDFNGRHTFANRIGFVPDELYEAADESCSGNFTNPPNDVCKTLVDAMSELTRNINPVQVIEPACKSVPNYLKLPQIGEQSARRYLEQNPTHPLSDPPTFWCRKYDLQILSIWANDETVQEVLHVHQEDPGTPHFWQSCNDSIIVGPAYTEKASSVVSYYNNLTNTNLKGLIYSGDHDMEIAYSATQKWIWKLNLTLEESWRAWSVNNETAGYVRFFTNGDFNLTFATVKGAGHFATEYKAEECFEMAERWLANESL
ncbi:hypothetical protein JCGZ_03332 [Jatropha curcas]|uniref:Serine carboxypeptidase-like 18 n=1 Tax=Jatropha curcas TaxID=180498 RepID=A0A067JCV4_JATCU|nr:serine carboxypeptidase-like 18 [Jatropha curcas]KDP21661.1 hypothetical protein JCGZ_03332 [Jatropha curcas]